MIDFRCQYCSTSIRAKPEAAGKIKACPKCRTDVTVPVMGSVKPAIENLAVANVAESVSTSVDPGLIAAINEHESGEFPCPYCKERIKSGALKCRFCGEFLSKIRGPQTAAINMCAVIAVLVAAWTVVQAIIPFLAEAEGLISPLIPIWNSIFACAVVMITTGVFLRREWARQWMIGTCVLNGIGNAIWAYSSDVTFIWVGVIVQAVGALVAISAKKEFSTGRKSTFDQLGMTLSAIAILGSIVVGALSFGQVGTEKGRNAFVQEMQAEYNRNAPGQVVVSTQGRSVVIHSPGDSREAVSAAMNMLRQQLRNSGKNAKVWLVGFTSVRITNGDYSETCEAHEF